MQVSAVQPAPQGNHSHYNYNMDAMDMDIDMDIDIGIDAEDFMEPELTQDPSNGFSTRASHVALPADPVAEQPAEPVPEKVHVRGLDNLGSADVKQFAADHFPLDEFVRIEWIDDTSANLIYNTTDAAANALAALTDTNTINMAAVDVPLLQLRPAKKLSTHPNSELFVRQATTIDVKKKGAADASRYYLLNPDANPRERKGPREPRRGRARQGSDDSGDYNRRKFDDREHKRRRDDQAFDANMYDDDVGETDRSSSVGGRQKRARHVRNGEDLFADRIARSTGGRLRDRSASPLLDNDGMMGFGTDSDAIPRAARRSRQRSTSPYLPPARANIGKELFPTLATQQSALADKLVKELFPSKAASSNNTPMRSSVELFPSKRQSFSNHRRSNAFDASEIDRAEFISGSPQPSRSLEERITGRPSRANTDEVRVRGAAQNSGISVRGMAAGQSVKELFPMKVSSGGNAGKELFGEKIKGRGAPRRKAEDMFH